jgi:hypothetical protein
MARSVALIFACLAGAVAKDSCNDSKAPCSGKSTFKTLYAELAGASAQSATSADLSLKYTDFSVTEIDYGKTWVTYTQGGKGDAKSSCKLPASCSDVSKMTTKARLCPPPPRARAASRVPRTAPRASPRAPPQKFCDKPNASFMGGTAKSYSKSQVDTFQKKSCK